MAEDFEVINKMAMEQIARMDGTKKVEVPPAVQRGSFWSNDYVSKYRSNEGTTSSYAPRTYYTSAGVSSSSSMDTLYRKTLAAVYKSERTESNNEDFTGGQIMSGTYQSLTLRSLTPQLGVVESNTSTPAVRRQISPDARNQVAAIVMSGAAKVFTTMVLNWARDKRVPYELLS